jgi:hypothetical protein
MTSYTPLTDEEREAQLWQLYDAVLKRLMDEVAGDGPVKASMLDVARSFLKDANVTARTRPSVKRGLAGLAALRALPFDQD